MERCEALAKLGRPPPLSRPWKLRRWLRAYRAIMALDISEAAEMLRGIYTPDKVAEMMARPNPLLKMLPMDPDRRWVDPVEYQEVEQAKDAITKAERERGKS